MIIFWKRRSSVTKRHSTSACAVNCRNIRIWGSANPHAYVEHQRDSPKVNVFSAVSSQKVYGPFFFVEETVTGMTYLNMLHLWLMSQLQNILMFLFRQERIPAHFHYEVRQYVNSVLPGRWIYTYIYIYIYIYIQDVTGGTDQTSGECSLC